MLPRYLSGQPLTPGQVWLLAVASLSTSFCSPLPAPSTNSSLQLMKCGERPHRQLSDPSFLLQDIGSRPGRPTGEHRRGGAGNPGLGSGWWEPGAQEAAPSWNLRRLCETRSAVACFLPGAPSSFLFSIKQETSHTPQPRRPDPRRPGTPGPAP